jgi:hypothetical protein
LPESRIYSAEWRAEDWVGRLTDRLEAVALRADCGRDRRLAARIDRDPYCPTIARASAAAGLHQLPRPAGRQRPETYDDRRGRRGVGDQVELDGLSAVAMHGPAQRRAGHSDDGRTRRTRGPRSFVHRPHTVDDVDARVGEQRVARQRIHVGHASRGIGGTIHARVEEP